MPESSRSTSDSRSSDRVAPTLELPKPLPLPPCSRFVPTGFLFLLRLADSDNPPGRNPWCAVASGTRPTSWHKDSLGCSAVLGLRIGGEKHRQLEAALPASKGGIITSTKQTRSTKYLPDMPCATCFNLPCAAATQRPAWPQIDNDLSKSKQLHTYRSLPHGKHTRQESLPHGSGRPARLGQPR